MIAVGPSQSAARLRTYVNGVHQHTDVFDGYIPFIDFGRGVPFAADSAGQLWGGGSSIRSDLDVPVIVVNSETEVTSYYGVREDDSDRFRLWEVAGTSHVSVPRPEEAGTGRNWLSYRPVYDASIRHLHRWIADGVEPPRMPRVDVVPGAGETAAAARPQVARDDHGNAVGGIRLPDVEVPTARTAISGYGTRDAVRLPLRRGDGLRWREARRPVSGQRALSQGLAGGTRPGLGTRHGAPRGRPRHGGRSCGLGRAPGCRTGGTRHRRVNPPPPPAAVAIAVVGTHSYRHSTAWGQYCRESRRRAAAPRFLTAVVTLTADQLVPFSKSPHLEFIDAAEARGVILVVSGRGRTAAAPGHDMRRLYANRVRRGVREQSDRGARRPRCHCRILKLTRLAMRLKSP